MNKQETISKDFERIFGFKLDSVRNSLTGFSFDKFEELTELECGNTYNLRILVFNKYGKEAEELLSKVLRLETVR